MRRADRLSRRAFYETSNSAARRAGRWNSTRYFVDRCLECWSLMEASQRARESSRLERDRRIMARRRARAEQRAQARTKAERRQAFRHWCKRSLSMNMEEILHTQ